jgi:hypothetical protein
MTEKGRTRPDDLSRGMSTIGASSSSGLAPATGRTRRVPILAPNWRWPVPIVCVTSIPASASHLR